MSTGESTVLGLKLAQLDSIFSIIAGVIAFAGAFVFLANRCREWWPTWRRRNTLRFQPVDPVYAGTSTKLSFIVNVCRDTPIIDYGVRFRDARINTDASHQMIRCWIEKDSATLPRRMKKGQSIDCTLFIEANQPWKGIMIFEASDGSGGICEATQRFVILPQI